MLSLAWTWLLRNPLQATIGAAAVACFIAAGVQSVRLDRSEQRHARAAQGWQAETLARERAARAAADEYRAREARWQQQKAAAEAHYAQTIAQRDRTIADLRRTAAELRQLAAGYAAGGRGTADDSIDACRARAATLAELFAEADAAAGDLAAAADAHADQVRVLQESWPQ
jgi:hypothetical protein